MHFLEFYWSQGHHQQNGHPKVSGKWHLKCFSTVFGFSFLNIIGGHLGFDLSRVSEVKSDFLHIWKYTSWYKLTMVEVSCFFQKVHNFHGYPLYGNIHWLHADIPTSYQSDMGLKLSEWRRLIFYQTSHHSDTFFLLWSEWQYVLFF